MNRHFWVALLIFMLSLALVACGSENAGSNDGEAGNENTENNQNMGNSSNEGNAEDSATNEEADAGDAGHAYPEETLEWTIAFGPGGGNDIMARTLIEILEKYELYPEPIAPENREGGSGAVGWGYLNNQTGNPYHISTTSGSFITTPLLSDTGFNYENFTHIALMAADDMFFLVPGDAPYDSLDDFVEAAKSKTFNIGGIGAANVDRLIPETFAEEAGIDIEYVSFNAQGEMVSAILSGSLDVIMGNPGEVAGQIEAGELKALAFSGQERLPRFDDVPTFIEEGYDVNIPMPRGIIMPGDIPEDVRNWWIETMKEVAETPEWQEYIDTNMLSEHILYGDEFSQYLEETVAEFEVIMTELGVIE